jgi:hypothetical protein
MKNVQIPPEAHAAWDRGDKIEALNVLRQATGLSLPQAVDLLESGAFHAPHPAAQVGAALSAAAGIVHGGGNRTRPIAFALKKKLAASAATPNPAGASSIDADTSNYLAHNGLAPGEVPRRRFGGMVAVVAVLGLGALAVRWYGGPRRRR